MKAYQQIPRRPIVTLFRDIPPSALFHLGQEFSHASHSHSRINFDIVARCLLTSWPTKSEDEIEHALKYLKSLMTGTAKPETVFYLTNLIGKTYLDFEDGQFHVATEHLLRWREISLQLDADLFTTSTLAWESTKAGKNLYQGNYGWPHVLLPENRKSRVLHDYGIVENHSHLNAIGNVFLPTWISLMNRVIGREGEFEKAGISKRHLGYDIHSDPKLPSLPLVHLVKLASLARAIVHRFIRKDVKEFHIWSEITSQMIRCPKLDFYFSQKIQNLISTCRSFSGGNGIDYAFPNSANNFPEEQNPIPIGERSLMHEFFLGLFSKNNKLYLEIADIFYFYILVKNRFRMEFIHSNGVTGFKNFYLYQDRKDRFIDNDPLISHTRTHFAALESKRDFDIQKIDLRFRPAENYRQLSANILAKSRMIDHSPKERFVSNNNVKPDIPIYWLTAHFIKVPEDSRNAPLQSVMTPRNQKLRVEVRRQTQAIAHLRMIRDSGTHLLKAIDAANSEIGCRPEVFAQAIRCLRMHELKPQSNSRQMIQKFWINKNSSLDIEPSRLKIKFHCGEEFLDLVDGMRAIDETILFLDMRKGDYLGHVLALGINVQEWYKRKPSTLFLPVQDILDNLVWLVGTARRFKIHSYPKEIKELESLILRYFNDIYREVPIHSILSPSELAQLLYQSWTLRGDNPFRYDRHRCLPDQPILTLWNKNDLNDSKRVEAWIRMNPQVTEFYWRYHFDQKSKEDGKQIKPITYSLKQQLLIAEVQAALLEYVTGFGLFIETLPSINVLLSPFKRYDEHVILRFMPPKEAGWPGPKLHVSVNSDNPGVIESNAAAELEYLAAGLRKAKDEKGEHLYNEETIDAWLKRIIQNGWDQAVDNVAGNL